MHLTIDRTSPADRLAVEVPDSGGCDARIRGGDLPPEADEDRAARRDALLHSLALARPRHLRRCRRRRGLVGR